VKIIKPARNFWCALCSYRADVSAAAINPEEIQLLREENAVLRAQIEWLKKQLFGAGKSEKLDRAQLLLKLAELEKLTAAAEAPTQTITYERARAPREKHPLAAETFAKLPVKETMEIIPEPVRAEPESYERIGEERTFEVDVVPPQLFKREIVRPKFKRRDDREQPPVIAPAPARAVQGGYASAGLLAWVALSKYVDHAPLYRLEQMSARWGASISRQTMADWIGITAEWLAPIYRRMQTELLGGGYVQADETPVRCNDPDEKRGGTTQGWLWVISRCRLRLAAVAPPRRTYVPARRLPRTASVRCVCCVSVVCSRARRRRVAWLLGARAALLGRGVAGIAEGGELDATLDRRTLPA
jgi:transposase